MLTRERTNLYKLIDELPDADVAKFRAILLAIKHEKTHSGSAWFRAAYESFTHVREAIAASGISSEEIDQDIDDAIDEVRREPNP